MTEKRRCCNLDEDALNEGMIFIMRKLAEQKQVMSVENIEEGFRAWRQSK